MTKTHVYEATANMAGVRRGQLFEADTDDPRVLSGHVVLVKKADVPDEVKEALAEAAQSASEPIDDDWATGTSEKG